MEGDTFSGLGNGSHLDGKVMQTFQKSFVQVQNILDQNRILINEINQNHESKVPDNLSRNVGLIRELNNNIRRVVDLYSDLSNNFSKSMEASSEGESSGGLKSDGKASHKRIRPGEKGRRIRELTSVVQKRFKFPENSVELYAEKVNNRGLCAIAQAESLRYKLLGGLAVRRACYGVLRFIMESGAKGCEWKVEGSLAKSMKFKDGYMISSGQPVKEYIDSAVRHVLLRQGVLGIMVKIMLAWDPKGKQGPMTPLPDLVSIHPPKEDGVIRPSTATSLMPMTADLDMDVAPDPFQIPVA